jgi:hypothetical protein
LLLRVYRKRGNFLPKVIAKDEGEKEVIKKYDKAKTSLSELYALGLSYLSITPEEFFALSPLEFYNAITETFDLEKGKMRSSYEAMRIQTWYLVSSQLAPEDRIPIEKINDFMPLGFDDPDDTNIVKESEKQEEFDWSKYDD